MFRRWIELTRLLHSDFVGRRNTNDPINLEAELERTPRLLVSPAVQSRMTGRILRIVCGHNRKPEYLTGVAKNGVQSAD